MLNSIKSFIKQGYSEEEALENRLKELNFGSNSAKVTAMQIKYQYSFIKTNEHKAIRLILWSFYNII